MKRFDAMITARLNRKGLVRSSLSNRSAHLHPASSEMAESTPTRLQEGAPATNENLPKLSLADLRTYNSMADHMELFVGIFPIAITACNTDKPVAQQFPPDMENTLCRLLQRATPLKHVTPSVPHHGP